MVINKQELSALIERREKKDFSVSVQDANDRQMYQAVVSVVRDILQQMHRMQSRFTTCLWNSW